MLDHAGALAQISLVTNHFGDGDLFGILLQDWFRFLGGKPGEVVVVDGGSDSATRRALAELQRAGQIDILEFPQVEYSDDASRIANAFRHEYRAGELARRPYLLFFHADTLPYRQGHADWLIRALTFLQRDDVFAISGSANLWNKARDAWADYYWSTRCSLNFALMRRARFLEATQEFAGEFIRSHFSTENPAHATGQDRYWIELAFESYMERHGVLTLDRKEDPTWTVFHTNTRGERLRQTRAAYFARKNIAPFLNAGANPKLAHPGAALYYGQPSIGFIKRARIRFGQTRFGPRWRALKQSLGIHS